MIRRRMRASGRTLGALLILLASAPIVFAASIHSYASKQPWGDSALTSGAKPANSNVRQVPGNTPSGGGHESVVDNAAANPWIFRR